MNELHLFAGSGGGILASSLLGHNIVCAVERDEWCQHVLVQRQNDRVLQTFPIWDVSDISVSTYNFQRETWVQTISGTDIGYLHTPTTMANFAAPSMQKHLSCRNYVQIFGKVTPWSMEYLMGWPSGWNAIEPLEMVKFQSWQQSHLVD